jgi:membrane-bound metal-dependent hydrolase YbcI (DUF457 family)
MFLLGHLVAGLAIGTLLYLYFHDPILIAASAIGSILPDLIDKPIGLVLFASTIGYGRLFTHSLLFSIIILIIGIVIWWRFRSFVGIALYLGILSHQLLDSMWLEPVNWYYPLFGQFSKPAWTTEDDLSILSIGVKDLTSPSEWLFALAVILLLIQVLHVDDRLRQKRLFVVILFALTSILAICGIIVLYCGGANIFCSLTGWKGSLNNIFAGVLLTGVAIVIMATHFMRQSPQSS